MVNAPFQQRLDPARDALTVAVKERQDIARGEGGADETRSDQTLPFVGADETHALQVANVVGQLRFQVACCFAQGRFMFQFIQVVHFIR